MCESPFACVIVMGAAFQPVACHAVGINVLVTNVSFNFGAGVHWTAGGASAPASFEPEFPLVPAVEPPVPGVPPLPSPAVPLFPPFPAFPPDPPVAPSPLLPQPNATPNNRENPTQSHERQDNFIG